MSAPLCVVCGISVLHSFYVERCILQLQRTKQINYLLWLICQVPRFSKTALKGAQITHYQAQEEK